MTNEQIAKKLGVSIEKINAIIEAGMVTVLKKEKKYFLTRDGLMESKLYAELNGEEAENIEHFYKMDADNRKRIVKEFNEVQETLGKRCMPMAFCI